MKHPNGIEDLSHLPELQAERAAAAKALAQTAMYLTSIEAEAQFTPLQDRLNQAHMDRHDAIVWFTDVQQRIFEAEL